VIYPWTGIITSALFSNVRSILLALPKIGMISFACFRNGRSVLLASPEKGMMSSAQSRNGRSTFLELPWMGNISSAQAWNGVSTLFVVSWTGLITSALCWNGRGLLALRWMRSEIYHLQSDRGVGMNTSVSSLWMGTNTSIAGTQNGRGRVTYWVPVDDRRSF